MRSLFIIGFILLGFSHPVWASSLTGSPTYTSNGYHLFPEWNQHESNVAENAFDLGVENYQSHFTATDSLKYEYLFVVKAELFGFVPLERFFEKKAMTAVSH